MPKKGGLSCQVTMKESLTVNLLARFSSNEKVEFEEGWVENRI